MRKRVPLVALCVTLVAGCARELPLALPPNAPAQVFELGGSQYTLDPSSDAYRALVRWVANNRSGWSHYYATPPGKGVIVRSGTLDLQFFDSTALAQTRQGPFVKSVPSSEYAFLRRSANGT